MLIIIIFFVLIEFLSLSIFFEFLHNMNFDNDYIIYKLCPDGPLCTIIIICSRVLSLILGVRRYSTGPMLSRLTSKIVVDVLTAWIELMHCPWTTIIPIYVVLTMSGLFVYNIFIVLTRCQDLAGLVFRIQSTYSTR